MGFPRGRQLPCTHSKAITWPPDATLSRVMVCTRRTALDNLFIAVNLGPTCPWQRPLGRSALQRVRPHTSPTPVPYALRSKFHQADLLTRHIQSTTWANRQTNLRSERVQIGSLIEMRIMREFSPFLGATLMRASPVKNSSYDRSPSPFVSRSSNSRRTCHE